MLTWWESLSLLQKVFVTMAVPSTLILILQSIMVLFGFASGGGDGDSPDSGGIDGGDSADNIDSAITKMELEFDDGDINVGGDGNDIGEKSSGLSLFTVRGIMAFFSIGGWMGLTLTGKNVSPIIAIPISFVVGSAALVGIAYIFKGVLLLQDNGNVTPENAIGKTAQVYLTIPATSKGKGKVTLVVQEKYMEFDACTHSSEPIKTGETVHVIDVLDDNTLIVEQTLLNKFPEYVIKK